MERGDAAGARASMAAANSLAAGLSEREASHIGFFDLLVAGDAEAALCALREHLNTWPRDAVALGPAAFTNGLIGSSGRAGQKRMLLELLDELAPSYGDDWWFAAHHGMALSENGQRRGRPAEDRALALAKPEEPLGGARPRASLLRGRRSTLGARLLASWLTTYPHDGSLYSHLSWHLALGHLEAGDAPAAYRLFKEAFAADVHSGPPRGKVNDAVSFLWRWELAGHPRDADAWRMVHDFATGAFPRAGVAFSDMHIALAQAVAGATQRWRRAKGRSTNSRGRSVSVRAPRSGGVARLRGVRARDFAAAIDALEPIAGELERIGGSRAQLDLVEFTLLQAYVGAEPPRRDAPHAEGVRRARLVEFSGCRLGGAVA